MSEVLFYLICSFFLLHVLFSIRFSRSEARCRVTLHRKLVPLIKAQIIAHTTVVLEAESLWNGQTT